MISNQITSKKIVSFFIFSALFINVSTDAANIKITSSDDQEFEIPEEIAQQSQTLKNLIGDLGTNDPIPLPAISGKTLGTIIDMLKTLYEKKQVDPKSTLDGYVFSEINYDDLKDLLQGGHYLDFTEAESVVAKKIADLLKQDKNIFINETYRTFTGVPALEKLISSFIDPALKTVKKITTPENLKTNISCITIRKTLFAAGSENGEIFVFTIDQNQNINLKNTINAFTKKTEQVVMSDRYIAAYSDKLLKIFDIADPAAPKEISQIDVTSISGQKHICINNNLVAMVSETYEKTFIHLWKITDENQPKVEKISDIYTYDSVSNSQIVPLGNKSFVIKIDKRANSTTRIDVLSFNELSNILEQKSSKTETIDQVTFLASYKITYAFINPKEKAIIINYAWNKITFDTITVGNPEFRFLSIFESTLVTCNKNTNYIYVIFNVDKLTSDKPVQSFGFQSYTNIRNLLVGNNIVVQLSDSGACELWQIAPVEKLEEAVQRYWKMSDKELAEARKKGKETKEEEKPTKIPKPKPPVPTKPSYIKSDLSFALNQLSKNLNGLTAVIKK